MKIGPVVFSPLAIVYPPDVRSDRPDLTEV
jgi:hypothetical protein